MRVEASVVIPTRDRTEELRKLLWSALAQTVPVEILVMDDGTSEATAEMIHNEFPQVHYYRLASSRGPAYQRNRGVELASNNFVFPVDDDVLFNSPRTVEQTLAEFGHPRVGAVGIPFINVRQDQTVRQRPPEAKAIYVVHAFVGAAHAVRRDVFLEVGGYREHFFYMGEEGDYCLRMLSLGYITRLGNADPIDHLESSRRDTSLADRSARRNDILFAWHNAPITWLPIHLAMTTINGFRCSVEAGNILGMLAGTASGYMQMWPLRHERRPVSSSIYRLHRRLKKRGPLRLEDIEGDLPPLRSIERSNVEAAGVLPKA